MATAGSSKQQRPPNRPDDSRERALRQRFAIEQIAGVDEVGRGPLAGPVVAAAAILPSALVPRLLAAGLNDSKKVTKTRRETLASMIRDHAPVAIAMIDVATIDRINILQASLMAMRQALTALGHRPNPAPPEWALIDGNRLPEDLPCPAECLVKGDQKSAAIAAAAIVAKDARDREMARLAEEHPGYGWARNAGYGTAEHLAALRTLGPTPHHRRSFAPVAALLGNSNK